MFGLIEEDIKTITSILRKNTCIEEAIIFGSRAKGNFKKGSDVDIALKGKQITHSVVNSIKTELNEETFMPYQFDVLDYNDIKNENLRDHINRAGKIIYHT